MEEKLLAVVTLVSVVAFMALKEGINYGPFSRSGGRRRKGFRPRPIEEQYLRELQTHFLYYQHLSPENKRRFEARVQAFIDSNEFIPRSYTHVNAEMKAHIAGAAIQLTFGFDHLNFEHFSKILIYQDDYYSRITRKYHQGEVNPHGLIVLSWNNFVQGYEIHDDGRNLGLHEMAHAMRIENAIYNGEYDFIDREQLKKFDRLAQYEIGKIQADQPSLFRNYAASNKHEFFAVAIENFFERPEQFKGYNRELYYTLSTLLKQDPIRLFKEYNSVSF